MTTSSESNATGNKVSKSAAATAPAMRRFIIVFVIVEAVLIGWALLSMQLR